MEKMKIATVVLVFFLSFSSCLKPDNRADRNIKEGDIIFHESQSIAQGEELKLATKSRYTHMGVIFKKNKKFFVYEAVQPVKVTPLKKWIGRGENKHYVIKRLKNYKEQITPQNIIKMQKYGKKFLGKNYDTYFQWSDKRIYCSELVWKIYKRALNIEICDLEKMKDFDLSHPKVKALIKKRYGVNIPLNETIVSPVKIFNSNKLITVITKN